MIKEKTVLIARNNIKKGLNLQSILEENKYVVHNGSNGTEALNLLSEHDIDVVISDIIMSDMTGYELCETIKRNDKTQAIPVILITNLIDLRDIINGLQSGADNIISAPFNDEYLLKKINDLFINQEIRKTKADNKFEVFYNGQMFKINSDRTQILDLLLSTYENAIFKNNELATANKKLKSIQQKLKEKNTKLEDINEDKNFFLGVAAHDLRSPLSTIMNFVELLQFQLKSKLNDDELKFIKVIEDTATYGLNMISNILDFSKIESGNMDLNKTEIELNSFLQQNVELNNNLANRNNINVRFNNSESNINIFADEDKLTQVMNNLISNAIKYSHQETNINVSIEKQKSFINVIIEDNGIGIEEKELDNIFIPFATKSKKGPSGEKSTGLGLATVKKIISAHNWEINVESEVGKGSTFTFSIPC